MLQRQVCGVGEVTYKEEKYIKRNFRQVHLFFYKHKHV